MSGPPQQDRNQDATCYMGNLDDRCTDALIWELMLQAGPIINVHLPKDRITAAHQGYGFAEFQTEADAEYACKIMNGIKLFGKPIRVNKASSDKKQIDIGANLFVGNLDAAVDERVLYETFSAFGHVVGLPKVARDPTTNASKNYGFISFDSFEAGDAAIESLNGQFLLNRAINVSYAMKKDGKGGERHGTAAERLLAAQARKNNAMPARAPPPPGLFAPPPPPPGGPPSMGQQYQQQYQQKQQPPQPPQPGTMVGGMPPPPPPGFGGYPQSQMPPPPPPGFQQSYHAGGPPPPPPQQQQQPGVNGLYHGGPPPPMQMQAGGYAPPPPPPGYMTGANNAPLGQR
ncbi:unnamed protein product [Jaminaea pallidilutea]